MSTSPSILNQISVSATAVLAALRGVCCALFEMKKKKEEILDRIETGDLQRFFLVYHNQDFANEFESVGSYGSTQFTGLFPEIYGLHCETLGDKQGAKFIVQVVHPSSKEIMDVALQQIETTEEATDSALFLATVQQPYIKSLTGTKTTSQSPASQSIKINGKSPAAQPLTPLSISLRNESQDGYDMGPERPNQFTSLPNSPGRRTNRAPLSAGASFRRYAVEFEELALLGKGSFGSVYRARNKIDGQEYAIKKVKLSSRNGRFSSKKITDHSKLIREVKTFAKISNHPNVVRYYAAWTEDCHSDEDTSSRESDESDANVLSGHKVQESNGSLISINDNQEVLALSVPEQIRQQHELFSSPQKTSSTSRRRNTLANVSAPHLLQASDHTSVTNSPYMSKSKKSKKAPKKTKQKSRRKPSSILYIQMQLYPNSDLRSWINNRPNSASPSLYRDMNLSIFRQIVSGLDHVHSKGFVHRDLKPDNIFIHDGHVYLGDFGLAKAVNIESNADSSLTQNNNAHSPSMSDSKRANRERSPDRRLLHEMSDLEEDPTRTNSSKNSTSGVGTYLYTSPEQLANTTASSAKSDVYSLGILFVELFQPFTTAMERAVVLTALRQKQIFPPEFARDFPEEMAFARRLLQHDPKLRPTTAEILQDPLFHTLSPMVMTSLGASPLAFSNLLMRSHPMYSPASSSFQSVSQSLSASTQALRASHPALLRNWNEVRGHRDIATPPNSMGDGLGGTHEADGIEMERNVAKRTPAVPLFGPTPNTADLQPWSSTKVQTHRRWSSEDTSQSHINQQEKLYLLRTDSKGITPLTGLPGEGSSNSSGGILGAILKQEKQTKKEQGVNTITFDDGETTPMSENQQRIQDLEKKVAELTWQLEMVHSQSQSFPRLYTQDNQNLITTENRPSLPPHMFSRQSTPSSFRSTSMPIQIQKDSSVVVANGGVSLTPPSYSHQQHLTAPIKKSAERRRSSQTGMIQPAQPSAAIVTAHTATAMGTTTSTVTVVSRKSGGGQISRRSDETSAQK